MHAKAYAQHASADLVGICDLDLSRAEKLSHEFDVPGSYSSVDELLVQGLDAVSIATPDAAHCAPALEAAAAGVHILVEKPMATTVDECVRMINAAKEHEVLLMVDWHNRWNPSMHHAWRAVGEGEVGEVMYVYYRLNDVVYVPTKMLPWASSSSVLCFLGSHVFDTVCWVLGQEPEKVTCRRKEGILTSMGIDTADMYLTVLDFASGATVVVENVWVLPQSAPALVDHRWEIIGSKGVLSFDGSYSGTISKHTEATPSGYPDVSYPDVIVGPQVHGRQLGFCVEPMYHFIECVRDGLAPLTSGADGLLNTRMLLATEESVRRGETVELAEF
jgi:predicted dehydrogenase